jgi:hypothetical protein
MGPVGCGCNRGGNLQYGERGIGFRAAFERRKLFGRNACLRIRVIRETDGAIEMSLYNRDGFLPEGMNKERSKARFSGENTPVRTLCTGEEKADIQMQELYVNAAVSHALWVGDRPNFTFPFRGEATAER